MRIIQLPNTVTDFIEYCKNQHGLEIRIKNKDYPEGLYRIISKFIKLFNPMMDDGYITVLFGDVWVPGNWFDESGRLVKKEMQVIELLIHEMVHEDDRKKLGSLLFSLIYLFPQVLGLLSLLSILSFIWPWMLWFLAFSVFLLPLPAPGRAWLEVRGYRINVAIAKLFNGERYAEIFAGMIFSRQFKSPAYYWMFPLFKRRIVKELLKLEDLNDRQKDMIKWYQSLKSP